MEKMSIHEKIMEKHSFVVKAEKGKIVFKKKKLISALVTMSAGILVVVITLLRTGFTKPVIWSMGIGLGAAVIILAVAIILTEKGIIKPRS